MTRYTNILAGYDPAATVGPRAPHVAAWLSGQASYRHSRLSPSQAELLRRVAAVGYTPVPENFPYNREAARHSWRQVPILTASLRNAGQYLAARLDRRFRHQLARHFQPVVDGAARRLVLLCGSSGLQLLAAALPALRLPPRLRILALALGPVSCRPAVHERLTLRVFQGRFDPWSRLGWRGPVDLREQVDHLGYAEHPGIQRAVVEAAARFLDP